MRPAFFCDFTECVLVVCYRRFGTTHSSHLQRSMVLFSICLSYTVFPSHLVFIFPFYRPFLYLTVASCSGADQTHSTPRKNTFFLPSTSFTPASLLASIGVSLNQSRPTPVTAYLSVTSTLVNVSKSTAIIFVRVGRHFFTASKSTYVYLYRESNQYVKTPHYVVLNLDK